ncbi:MAG: sarcosine oxidase subunit gamma [Paracoccaceae bacterium]
MTDLSLAKDMTDFSNGITVTTPRIRGMISLRGDLALGHIRNAVEEVTGVVFPEKGQVQFEDDNGCVWMSPDEVLIFVNVEETSQALSKLHDVLAAEHCLVLNVSDARVLHQVHGKTVRDVLAKLTPANLTPQIFGPGQVRRTRIGQVAGAIWMLDAETVQVVAFRSTSDYVFNQLKHAAREGAAPDFHQL